MQILKIKIKPEYILQMDQELRSNYTFVWLILFIGFVNILFEFVTRRIFELSHANVLVESFHILVYFVLPVIYLKHARSVFLYTFLLLFTVLGSLLYLFIEQGVFPGYCSVLFPILALVYISFIKGCGIGDELLVSVNKIKSVLLYAMIASVLLSSHLVFTVMSSNNYYFQSISILSLLPNIAYMVFGILGSEIFFRGLIFNTMNRGFAMPFWMSAGVSTLLFTGPFIANPFFTNNSLVAFAVIFYVCILGFVSCFITKATKSIAPAYFVNIVMAVLRYFIILGPI